MNDDIRPKGTVQVRCTQPGCGWSFWLDPMDSRLPDGPFVCTICSGDDIREKEPDIGTAVLSEFSEGTDPVQLEEIMTAAVLFSDDHDAKTITIDESEDKTELVLTIVFPKKQKEGQALIN